jgi:hypothetical protein
MRACVCVYLFNGHAAKRKVFILVDLTLYWFVIVVVKTIATWSGCRNIYFKFYRLYIINTTAKLYFVPP